MSRFHVLHVVPSARHHGLRGYQEVIDSLVWGLEELGHTVSTAVNRLERGAVHIVLGAQMLSPERLARLPPDTVVYNFEQLRGLSPQQVKPSFRYCAEHFRIWDYSAANEAAWRAMGASRLIVVPVAYAPVLTRIPRPQAQDIDVLLYGMPAGKRLQAFTQLARAGLTTVFVCGLYGQARDDLIGRSKLVLNVNLYDFARVFEVVRVSYLLANRKAVVATREPDTSVEDDLAGAVHFCAAAELLPSCERLLADGAARAELERRGFETFSRRDVRQVLREALAQTP